MASELEKAITDAFKNKNITALKGFLQNNTNEALKCSAQFLNKLDKFVTWSLDEKHLNAACVAFAVLHICGRNLKFPAGSQGITGIIHQGLIQKMFQWFDKCKQLWIQHGPQWDKSLSTLSEDFFDAVTMVHKASKEGMMGIQCFLYSVGQLVYNVRVCVTIRKEAICALNIILKKMAVSPGKEKFLTSQEASDMMMKLAGQIMLCGDYDLQVALIEVLFRMTTPDQRKKLKALWFSVAEVACAFGQIHPSEFEADCRTFLIFVNGLQGDSRRVISYPCLDVYLDNFQLLRPADDKLDKFWIDFNLGSRSISFYFSFADEKSLTGLWDSICIPEKAIRSYTVTEKGPKQFLQLQLSEEVMAGSVKGSSITITFCSTLNIRQAVTSVYGKRKEKSTAGKTSSVNMTLKIVIDEDKSQNVVPESQVSLGDGDKNTASCLGTAKPTSLHISADVISGLTTSSNRSSKGSIQKTNKFTENKRKPSLEIFCASDRRLSANLAEEKTTEETFKYVRTKQNIPVVRQSERMQAGQVAYQSQEGSFVPDTQPLTEQNARQRNKHPVSEIPKRPIIQKNNPLPNSEQCSNVAKKQVCPFSAQTVIDRNRRKQLHSKSTRHLQQVIRERNTEFALTEGARAMTLTPDQKSVKENIPEGSNDLELHIPKEVQAQGKQLDKTMSRGRQSLMAASTEASTSNQARNSNKRAMEAVGNMVKLISSYHTKNNQSKEKDGSIPQRCTPAVSGFLSTGKKNAQAVDLTKSHSKITSNAANKRKDVFEFDIDETLSIGGTFNTFLGKPARSRKDTLDSSVHFRTTRTRLEEQNGNNNLFSGRDDINSLDVSWLRESSKKAKLKTTYARKQPITSRTLQPSNSITFPVVPQIFPKPGKSDARLNKVMDLPKKDIPEPGKPFNVNKRPRRRAALAKSYKEPDTDESLSESENPQATKACEIIQTDKPDATRIFERQTSKCPRPDHSASSSSTKKMRFTEMSTQSLELAFSPFVTLPLCCSSPKEKSVIQLSSLPLPFSPLLAPSKLPPITASHISELQLNCSFSQESVSQVSLSLSFTSGVQQMPNASQANSQKTEKTPHSNEDCPDSLVVGPNRKRRISLSSNSDEKERQKRKCPPRLKSRVLFNSFSEESSEDEISHLVTTSFSVMTNHWNTDEGNGDIDVEDLELPDVGVNLSCLSPQLTAKLKTKFQIQNGFKTMDAYYKENMNIVQQHISSLSTELCKHRMQKCEDVKNIFLQEIHNLEQGKAVLNNMDKDLNICLEKQQTFFRLYHEQESKSIEFLKTTLRDMRLSPEYEKPLFASQMAHLKKDMKSIQEKVLRTMHKEALESLRRSLRAWVLVD
ncbi:uncharacterized protein sycp2 isoform X2 [Vanacampus margaritifer]